MSDLVLVQYDAGDEYVVTPRGRLFAEVNNLKVLDEPAIGRDGSIVAERRVPKRGAKTSVASATEKKAAKSANNNPPSKEN